ncbi:MAG: Hpt domain-containing protein, partial [Sphingobacteriales bacterium]
TKTAPIFDEPVGEFQSAAEDEFPTLTDVDLLLTDADIAELSALEGYDDLADGQTHDEQGLTDESFPDAQLSAEEPRPLERETAQLEEAATIGIEELAPVGDETDVMLESSEAERDALDLLETEGLEDELESRTIAAAEIDIASLTDPEPTAAEQKASSSSETPTTELMPLDDGDWVDGLDEILRRFGGKRALFQKMLANLEPETRRLLDELNSAAADNDRSRAITAAHSIKGTAATLGAKALSNRAAWLEKRLKISQLAIEDSLTPHTYAALDEALAAAVAALGQALAA